MNWKSIKAAVNVAKHTIVKHSPEILMGLGAASFVTTIILASKESIKEQDILIDHEAELDAIEEMLELGDLDVKAYKKSRRNVYINTAITTTKNYIPAVAFTAVSLSCFFGAYGIMRKRYTTLVVAYTALEESFRKYRERVVADKGADADLYYLTGAKPKEITVKDEEGNKSKQKQLILPDGTIASPYAFKFSKYKENGERNLQWSESNIINLAYVEGQMDWANDQLWQRTVFDDDHMVVTRGWWFLNETRELLGESATPTGAVVGNLIGNGEPGANGYVEWNIIEATEVIFDPEEGKEVELPCLFLNPNCDGMIYDLVGKKEKPFQLSYDPHFIE